MRNLSFYFAVFVVALALALAGCGGGSVDGGAEVEVEEVLIEGVAGGGGNEDAGASASGIGEQDGIDGENLDGQGLDGQRLGDPVVSAGDQEPLAMRVVYFDYDSSILSAEGEAVVQAHARYLQNSAGVQVILEGHSDERGTREYNLALAEDRAKAVANVLQAWGVGASRIQTVSYGEERPIALGHDDDAWHLNRRVEILYQ